MWERIVGTAGAPATPKTIPSHGHGTGKAEMTRGGGRWFPRRALRVAERGCAEVGKARNPRAGGARMWHNLRSLAELSGVPVPEDGAFAAGALWFGRVVLRFSGLGKVGTFASGTRRWRSLRVPLLPPAPV